MSEKIQTPCMYRDDIECPVLPKIRSFIKFDSQLHEGSKNPIKGFLESGALVLQTLAMFCGSCDKRHLPFKHVSQVVARPVVARASPRFECPYCVYFGMTPDKLNEHVKIMHLGKHEDFKENHLPVMNKKEAVTTRPQPIFKCPYCDNATSILSNLNSHVLSHHRDKHEDFKENHLPEMIKRFKELRS